MWLRKLKHQRLMNRETFKGHAFTQLVFLYQRVFFVSLVLFYQVCLLRRMFHAAVVVNLKSFVLLPFSFYFTCHWTKVLCVCTFNTAEWSRYELVGLILTLRLNGVSKGKEIEKFRVAGMLKKGIKVSCFWVLKLIVFRFSVCRGNFQLYDFSLLII